MHVRRLLILITLSIAALFLITFAFFSPSLNFASHHQHQHHGNEIRSSSTTGDDHDNKKQLDDSSSSSLSNNNNKPLLDFLQKEQLLLPPYDQQIFACYDLIVSTHGAATSIDHNNDEACQKYLSKHSKIIIDHHSQGIKWSTNSNTDYDVNDHNKLLLSQLFDSNHSSLNSFAFSSTASSSSSEKVLTDQRLYTHSKKMKNQAKMNFVKSSSSSSSFETYQRALESAVGKLATKQQQQQQQQQQQREEDNHHEETDNDDEDIKYVQSIQSVMRERFDPDFKEHHPDLQKTSGKDENENENGNMNKKNKKNNKNKSHHQFNFILKLPQLDVADKDSRKVAVIEALVKFFEEHDEFLHKLISVFIEHDERSHVGTTNSHHHDIDKQKHQHRSPPHKMLINFIFVGLDDQQLLKEILKIFVQDRHKKEHCRIISSSNKKKATSSRRRSTDDIVAVSCDNNDHQQYGENNNEDNIDVHPSDEKHLAPHSLLLFPSTTTIDPSFFCDSYSPSSIDVKNALKFGTKTGVYTGYQKLSMIARHKNNKKQRTQQKLVLIKHYNLVQYVHGFGNGLHDFLASPFSFLHPSIVMPTGACAFVSSSSSSTQALTKSNNNNNNNIDSLSTTENVFQFQPFIQKQMSLTKFMAHQRKLAKNYHQKNDNDNEVNNNKKNKKSSSSSSSFFGLLTWRDRLDLSLQLLCTFNFLHSHPDGPFSFDDNHPDQYLVVDNNNHNNNNNDHEENQQQEQQQDGLSSSSSSLSFYTSSKARYLLKMVDIDTLQKATRNKRTLVIKTKNQQKKKASPPVRDPQIKFGENNNNNNNNDNNNKNQNVDDITSANQYLLTCRCFYCRGRSNCLFVNSLEGYKSCGQYHSKDFGDEGNKEVLSSISNDIVVRSGDDDEDINEGKENTHHNKKKCTVLTDSWYLGQVLYFIGTNGELLFPTMYSMKEVIEMIEKGVMKNDEQNTGQELALSEVFPHLLVKNKKKKKNDPSSSIQHEFDKVVKKLLVDRISPREAARMLLEIGTKKKGESADDENVKDNDYLSSFTEKDWCPMVYNHHHVSSDTDVDGSSPSFHGLKVAV